MGSDKQLLAADGQPMLAAVLESLRAAKVEGIALVTRSAIADALADRLPANTFVAINDDPGSEMIDSVRIGLAAWAERVTLGDRDGFLVFPGDQPGMASADFDACIEAFREAPPRIVIATQHHCRGHPIIFPASFVSFVQSAGCNSGLNRLPHAHPQQVVEVSCASQAVTRDVDTPADYRKLQ
jgi:CTP:molybdopterin cytidylyltransferase MocA